MNDSTQQFDNALRACLPADGWLDIPQLRARLREYHGVRIGPGALGDELRRLHLAGSVRLGAWQHTLGEIPHPEHALVGPDSIVLYYVARGN